jgi:hypothetical protein
MGGTSGLIVPRAAPNLHQDSLPPGVQVWFCTVKGLKPWLEADALNTRTNEQGGHTVW